MTFMLISSSAVQPVDYERVRLRSITLPHVQATETVKSSEGEPREQSQSLSPIPDPYRSRREEIQENVTPVFVHEIMSSPAEALQPDATVSDAWAALRRRKIHHLPIEDKKGILIGILSDRDLLRISATGNAFDKRSQKLSEVMRRDVLTAARETTIRAAAEVLVAQRIGCLPITRADGTLLGIVTRTDILRTVVMRTSFEIKG